MPLNDELSATPFDVLAPVPQGGLITLRVSETRIKQLAQQGKTNDIFAFFYNLCGVPIPVNNFGYHEQKAGLLFPDHWGGIKHAHAIFKGINRPFKEANLDLDVYIYVVHHEYVYKNIGDMVCLAKRVPAPSNSLFVAYVVFTKLFEEGVVTNWEWVPCDPVNKMLPKDYLTRYESKVWENG